MRFPPGTAVQRGPLVSLELSGVPGASTRSSRSSVGASAAAGGAGLALASEGSLEEERGHYKGGLADKRHRLRRGGL